MKNNHQPIPESVKLFSPLFAGSDSAWLWICAVSNGRYRDLPELTEAQAAYARRVGYLPFVSRA